MKHLALLTFTLICVASAVNAAQSLRFTAAKGYKEKKVVSFVQKLKKTAQAPYNIYKIDLNDDAIDEYIVRPSSNDFCPQSPLCPYTIVAFENHEPIVLGEFDAHKMLISEKKTYGINDIIVYNQRNNDFKTTNAVWDPYSFRYIVR